jgi:hypothetical protein
MAGAPTKFQINLTRFVIALLFVCVVAGLIVYGASGDQYQRLWRDLVERPTGPMAFRMLLQPLMAAIIAGLAGIRDAKAGRPPYFWTIVSHASERRDLLFEGVVATSRVILVGVVVDAIYQLIVLKTFYPGEAAIVAVVLCFLPYLLLRGPVARLAYWWLGKRPPISKIARPSVRQPVHGARH